jgi:hypothetical protein
VSRKTTQRKNPRQMLFPPQLNAALGRTHVFPRITPETEPWLGPPEGSQKQGLALLPPHEQEMCLKLYDSSRHNVHALRWLKRVWPV